VTFEPWVDYAALPARIHRADILLGVFGTTQKAGRVIPNKVYQALACGKPLITRQSPAYQVDLMNAVDSGVRWIAAGDADALAVQVADLAGRPQGLASFGRQARQTYLTRFSRAALGAQLRQALSPFFCGGSV